MGSVATDIRGSIAGVTFSRNRGGIYSRARVTPLNPRSTRQTQVRAAFGANAKSWSGLLTADQRSAWTFFAQSNPAVNVFGDSIILSGISMFQRLNQVLSNIPAATITDAPSDLSVPALATATGFSVTTSAPLQVEFATNAQAVVAGAKYYCFATRPLSPGTTPQKSDYRYIGAVAATAAATAVDVGTDYTAVFPGDPVPGQVVGGLIATVNTTTGALTPGLTFSTVVT